MKFLKYLLLLIIAGAGGAFFLNSKKNKPTDGVTIAFYNVENLYDTEDDPHTNDNDFLPFGKNRWSAERYRTKLRNLAEVISKLGDDNGPEVLGLAEVENLHVVKDLIYSTSIKSRNYKIIHFNSPDKRGIDVALVYKEGIFKPFVQKSYRIEFEASDFSISRDILVAGGTVKSDTFYFLVNHWPSRREGKEDSEGKRIAAAKKLKSISDSIHKRHPASKLVLMGDFNDEPIDKSIKQVLGASTDAEDKASLFYNPFGLLVKDGRGSIRFQKQWDVFDQIIISRNMMKSSSHKYLDKSADVYDPDWMFYKEDRNSGPYRTFSGIKYYGGFSDHFPVFIQLSN